jgi:hypothetical protein
MVGQEENYDELLLIFVTKEDPKTGSPRKDTQTETVK